MIDSDLAEMYQVETKNLNRAVSRNKDRFPENFRFQLNQIEFDEYEKTLRFQNGTLENGRGKHRKYLPYVFTEQGVSMLSAVLRSETAIKVSIQIIDAFVDMRKFISQNANVFSRLSNLEQKHITTEIQLINTNSKIDKVLNALEDKSITPKQGIFYNGQIFDAYKLISDFIRSAKKSIILIDNYIDDSVLMLFTKCKKDVDVAIYTKSISKILKQDIKKFNSQYSTVKFNKLKTSHDRFLIIDKKFVYHFGASLKDLGKKWFAFSKLNIEAKDIIEKL